MRLLLPRPDDLAELQHRLADEIRELERPAPGMVMTTHIGGPDAQDRLPGTDVPFARRIRATDCHSLVGMLGEVAASGFPAVLEFDRLLGPECDILRGHVEALAGSGFTGTLEE